MYWKRAHNPKALQSFARPNAKLNASAFEKPG
jgi:hypothetical protein